MGADDSLILFDLVREGQPDAQQELFDKYVVRLLALIRKRTSPKYARRVDPNDVVSMALASFFESAEDDRFVVAKSGDLWRLLAAIAVNKLYSQIERNQADRRNVDMEQSVNFSIGSSNAEVPVVAVAHEPTPESVAGFNDELQWICEQITEQQRTILQHRLAGCTIDEIAEKVGCSERTVRRFFNDTLKPMLEKRLTSGGE